MTGYWFMSWQEVSVAGGAIFKSAVLEDTHPFEYVDRLYHRYDASDVRCVVTLLNWRPITAEEYALGEKAGMA